MINLNIPHTGAQAYPLPPLPQPPVGWGMDITEIIAATVVAAASAASKSLAPSPNPLGGRISALKGIHLLFVCGVDT